MYSAYLKFEGTGKAEIEQFRKKHDSLSDKIEAHITVVFPNNKFTEAEIINSIQRLGNLSRSRFELSSTITYVEPVGYLKLTSGKEYAENIYNKLSEILEISSKYAYEPHVTVVRDSVERPLNVDVHQNYYTITGILVEAILGNGVSQVIYHQDID